MAFFYVLGCTPSARWQNPGLPEDQWARDVSVCKRLAMLEVEKEFATGGGRLGGGSTYQVQMMQYESGKRQNDLINRCMRAKGYVKAGD